MKYWYYVFVDEAGRTGCAVIEATHFEVSTIHRIYGRPGRIIVTYWREVSREDFGRMVVLMGVATTTRPGELRAVTPPGGAPPNSPPAPPETIA